jgi:anti-sigma factor RsiW
MQHLDEGTIHAWLDGALSLDEAAVVEAHVAECPQCAAAVAEARGFIAASSRILTALDHVPRGVVPVARPARWSNPAMWRAAAAVLVVAAGSLVVARNTGNRSAATESSPTAAKSEAVTAMPSAPAAAAMDSSAQTSVAAGSLQRNSVAPERTTAKRATTQVPADSKQGLVGSIPQIADLGKAAPPSSQPSIRATDNSAAAAPAPITAVGTANGVTTVTWTDAGSGNVLKLSGRLPLAQLQQIKIRIEREREAAAAAAKKNP